MKSIYIFMLAIFAVLPSAAQDKFTFNKEGLTDFIVVPQDGKTAAQLYADAMKWIKENYTNPDEVIKTTIENDMIRIQGYKDSFYCVSNFAARACSNAIYTIEIEFKDGKFRFNPISLELTNSAGRSTLDLGNGSAYYDKSGKLRKNFEDFPGIVEGLFNGLASSLTDRMAGKKSNW